MIKEGETSEDEFVNQNEELMKKTAEKKRNKKINRQKFLRMMKRIRGMNVDINKMKNRQQIEERERENLKIKEKRNENEQEKKQKNGKVKNYDDKDKFF